MIPTPKIKVKVPQKLFYPVTSGNVRIELLETVIGMDAEVWGYLTMEGKAQSKEATSKVDTYLAVAQQDADSAWKTLCGEAIYFIRARKQNATTVATKISREKTLPADQAESSPEGIEAFSGEEKKPSRNTKVSIRPVEPKWLEPPGQFSPSAGYVAREACRDEDLIKAQTVALYAAWCAENSDWVQRTRGRIMARQLIKSSELNSFLSSPALRVLTVTDLAQAGVAVCRAFSRLENDEPIDKNDEPIDRSNELAAGQGQKHRWTIYFPEYQKQISWVFDKADLTTLSRLLPESVNDEINGIQDLPFLPGSVLEELLVTAQHLTFRLLRCTLQQALAFFSDRQSACGFSHQCFMAFVNCNPAFA